MPKNNKLPEISLCMIVKDAEQYLKKSIDSVKDLVSEIIVVDTGSSDGSVEIAEKSGAKIYKFKWNDDFSAARNFSISKAKGEWILILDSDESISKQNLNKLKNLDFINNTAFYLNLKSKVNIGKSFNYVTNAHPRLFKNNLDSKRCFNDN